MLKYIRPVLDNSGLPINVILNKIIGKVDNEDKNYI